VDDASAYPVPGVQATGTWQIIGVPFGRVPMSGLLWTTIKLPTLFPIAQSL